MMPADRIAWAAPPGSWLVVDTVGDDNVPGHVCTPDVCAGLVAAGVRAVIRMVRPDSTVLAEPDTHGGDYRGCYSPSALEVDWILASGLGLSIYQARAGRLTGDAGDVDGAALAAQAEGLGLAPGTHLWHDLEGSAAVSAGELGCRDYLRSAGAGLVNRGWGAGAYYDDHVPLSPGALWALPYTTAYWLAGAPRARGPARRGACLVQEPQIETIAGMRVDRDTLRQDLLGQGPRWTITRAGAARWRADALAGLLTAPDPLVE